MLNRVDGEMLKANLLRRGVNLAVDGNLLYLDVQSRRVGINTVVPTHSLTVEGNARVGNVSIDGNAVLSSGNLVLAPDENVIVETAFPHCVAFYGPNKELSFSTALNFDGTTLAVSEAISVADISLSAGSILGNNNLNIGTTTGNVNIFPGPGGSVNVSGLSLSGLVPNRFLVTDSAGNLTTDPRVLYNVGGSVLSITEQAQIGSLTFNATTISSPSSLSVDSSTIQLNGAVYVAGRQPTELLFTGAAGEITSDSLLTFNTGVLAVDATRLSSGLINTLTGDLHLGAAGDLIAEKTIKIAATSQQPLIEIAEADSGSISRVATGTSLRVVAGTTETVGRPGRLVFDAGGYTGSMWNEALAVYTDGRVYVGSLAVVGDVEISGIRLSGSQIIATVPDTNLDIITTGSGLVNIHGSGGVVLPGGSTAARPSAPPLGTTRYNSEKLVVEMWDGTRWAEIGPNYVEPRSQSFNGDGSSLLFVLDYDATPLTILVSINGIVQQPFSAYSIMGDSILFASAPEVTDVVEIRYLTGAVSLTVALADPTVDSGEF